MVLTTPLFTGTRSEVKDYLETIFLYGATGDDNTTPTPSDTTLGNETFRDNIDTFDKDSQVDKVTATLIIGTTQNNGNDVDEYGIFDDPTTGTMYVRDLLNTISKTSDIQLYIDETLTIEVVEVT
jgi:hypothetical protein